HVESDPMRFLATFFLCASAFAQVFPFPGPGTGRSTSESGSITSLTVVSISNTQAMLSYTAPDANPCSIEVSENSSYSPLVNDVNSTLFPGDNLDSRDGDIASGTSRIVMLGRRLVRTAADGNRYSLALQTNTPHYARVTCGAATATVS